MTHRPDPTDRSTMFNRSEIRETLADAFDGASFSAALDAATDALIEKFAIFPLAEPAEDEMGKRYFPVQSGNSTARVVVYGPNRIESDGVSTPHRSIDAALSHARALYAAALWAQDL